MGLDGAAEAGCKPSDGRRTTEARDGLVPRLAGIALLISGAALLWYFVENPIGPIPGFQRGWKGGPMLLGACFCCAMGGLTLILRRFSLAAFLISGLLAGAFSAAATGYVNSLKEIDRWEVSIMVKDPRTLAAFVEALRKNVTATRVEKAAEKLGDISTVHREVDFESMEVSYGVQPNSEYAAIVSLTFGSSPYVHPRRTWIRNQIYDYVRMIATWERDDFEKQPSPQPLAVAAVMVNFCLTTQPRHRCRVFRCSTFQAPAMFEKRLTAWAG